MRHRFSQQTTDDLIALVAEAAKAVLSVYESDDFGAENKADSSPLTRADSLANDILCQGLARLTPEISVVSEENPLPADFDPEALHWLVDPLDGTREFIKRNGEFTVNIGLIEHRRPVFGIIAAPVHERLWVGDLIAHEAFCLDETGAQSRIHCRPADPARMTALGSRSHAASGDDEGLSGFTVTSMLTAGSSLKFCLIAEGRADIYSRAGPTMEWDTAAGQAILEAAGGQMMFHTGEPFTYGKEGLLNAGGFIARGA